MTTPPAMRPGPAAPAAPTTPTPQLVALSPAVIGTSFAIGDAEITIGRADDCTIRVSHPLVSRTHAHVSRLGDRYVLVDASSANGTYLNGQRVLSPQLLRGGDEIGVADVAAILRFVDPDGTRARPDQLRFDMETSTFFFQDRALQLGQTEFKLLLHLRANVGRVCSRESCVYAVWRARNVDSYRGALDQHIHQIRNKLQAIDPRCNLIQTVRGAGYMLQP